MSPLIQWLGRLVRIFKFFAYTPVINDVDRSHNCSGHFQVERADNNHINIFEHDDEADGTSDKVNDEQIVLPTIMSFA